MFFHIAQQPQENYPCHWQLGSFSISTDNGWVLAKAGAVKILYKGYVDSGPIESFLETIAFQTTPHLTGNFCLIVVSNDTLTIQTDRYRSFPIYIDDVSVNNLMPRNHTAWADSLITIHQDFAITENKFDVIGPIENNPSTIDDINQILVKKVQAFKSQVTAPVKVFLSGGVDTLLLYSYIKRYDVPHEIVWNYHIDFDYFWLNNHHDIQNHWGYTQFHHWNEPTILVSGAPGDEFTLRSPTTANWYLLHHGTSILDKLNENSNCLHREYFKRYQDMFVSQIKSYQPDSEWRDLVRNLCNNVVNDWQHWHLGNTLTWTPLRDLDLFKLFLRLPMDLAIAQIMNSTVSCKLIEQNVPGLTNTLSDQKNTGNYMKNIQKLRDNGL